jgi:hypothetical protein
VLLTPVANLPLVLLIPVQFATGVIDTNSKFAAGIIDIATCNSNISDFSGNIWRQCH